MLMSCVRLPIYFSSRFTFQYFDTILNELCLNLRKLDIYEYDPMTHFAGSTKTYGFGFFKFLKENTTSNI